MGTQPPSPKRCGARALNFRPTSTAWIKMPLGMEVGLSLHDTSVRWGPSFPSPKGHSPAQFSANVHCGQTAGWTKMPLGMKVGLSPGDFVFDGDPATTEKGHNHPNRIFGPYLLWPNGWMDQAATWYRGKPRSRRRCVRWGRTVAAPPKRGTAPNFRFMSIVAKRLDG